MSSVPTLPVSLCCIWQAGKRAWKDCHAKQIATPLGNCNTEALRFDSTLADVFRAAMTRCSSTTTAQHSAR